MATMLKSAIAALMLFAGIGAAQDQPLSEPAQIAFEEGRWADAIVEYREILDAYPEDRLSWLRIAQAERELGRFEAALESLDRALDNTAPEAMVHLERARNLAGLGRRDEAIAALEMSDHLELRARVLLEEAEDFDSLRDDSRFQRVYRSVRGRVFPCEGMAEAAAFDFWVGDWEVRGADGSLLGTNSIIRDDGGCVVRENWESISGATGSSMTFYLPSRSQWRHVWIGSGGTHIDLTGGPVDGEIRLEGTIEYLDQDQVIAFRATWSVAADGRVRQRMEQFDLVARTWDLWFDGFFSRQN